jgi:hypothetical protein
VKGGLGITKLEVQNKCLLIKLSTYLLIKMEFDKNFFGISTFEKQKVE